MAQQAKAPGTLAEMAKEAEGEKTQAELELEGGTAVTKAAEVKAAGKTEAEYIRSLENENAQLRALLELATKGKPLPKPKRERPAGKYRMVSPMWDGTRLVPKGTEVSFPEGKAPQDAVYLG